MAFAVAFHVSQYFSHILIWLKFNLNSIKSVTWRWREALLLLPTSPPPAPPVPLFPHISEIIIWTSERSLRPFCQCSYKPISTFPSRGRRPPRPYLGTTWPQASNFQILLIKQKKNHIKLQSLEDTSFDGKGLLVKRLNETIEAAVQTFEDAPSWKLPKLTHFDL